MNYFQQKLTVCYLGNFTKDTIKYINKTNSIKETIGGSVYFGLKVIRHFFPNIYVQIHSNGLPKDLVITENISLVNHRKNSNREENFYDSSNTLTHFLLEYVGNERKLYLKFYDEHKLDITKDMFNKNPDVLFVVPIFHEISEDTIISFHRLFPDCLIASDFQGWLRTSGNMEIKQRKWKPSVEFINSLSVIKVSVDDLKSYSKKEIKTYIQSLLIDKNKIISITGGEKGSLTIMMNNFNTFENLFWYYCPAVKIDTNLDSTGAGDVWLTTFTLLIKQTSEIILALATATIIATLHIQSETGSFLYENLISVQKMIENQKKAITRIEFENGINKFF